MEEDTTLTREEMLEEQAERGPIEFMGYDEEMLRLIVQDFERRANQPMEAPLPPPPGPGGTFGAMVPPVYIDIDAAEQATDQLRATNERAERINRTQEEWERIYQTEEDLADVNRMIGVLQSLASKPKQAVRGLSAVLHNILMREMRDLTIKRDKARGE